MSSDLWPENPNGIPPQSSGLRAQRYPEARSRRGSSTRKGLWPPPEEPLVPAELRARGIGWFNTTAGILQLIASLVAGVLWDRVGHTAVFFYGAVFAAVGIVALLTLMPVRPRAGS